MGKSKERREQAGVIPIRFSDGVAEVCVITTSRGNWAFPKGYIEKDESDEEAALKEAYEEAGIHGAIEGDALGTYETNKTGNSLNVTVFLMQVEREDEDWPESGMRQRRWVSVNEAKEIVALDSQRELLNYVTSRLQSD